MKEGAFHSWLLAVIILAVIGLLIWRIVFWRVRPASRSGPFVLPLAVVLRPRPLLGERELLLYNLIRLAVEDRYLVFTKVPLLSFLMVEAEDEPRLEVLRHLALKRADVVLVHPGSRVVEQVVQWEDEARSNPDDARHGGEVQRILQAAGMGVTTLSLQPSYTVQELERLLGISDSV
jgi:hypothetical protein